MKKQVSLFLLLFSSIISIHAQTGLVKGVVTYKGEILGEGSILSPSKPDIGAIVKIMSPEKSELFVTDLKACNKKEPSSKASKAYYEYMIYKKEYDERPPFTSLKKIKPIRDKMNKAKKESESYNDVIKKAERCESNAYINYLSEDNYVNRTVVDGIGNYKVNLSPNKYIVLIESKSKLFIRAAKYLEIKENRDVEFSYEFNDMNGGIDFVEN